MGRLDDETAYEGGMHTSIGHNQTRRCKTKGSHPRICGRHRDPNGRGDEPCMVPKAGLEPARLAPHAPQTCVSAIPPLRHSAGYYNEACHHVLGLLDTTTYNIRHRFSLTLARSQRPYHKLCVETLKSAYEGKRVCIIEVAQNSCQ